jgi:hypothetical protein
VSQLVEVLYPVPDLRRTALSSLKWWESRRLQYNKIVGATGLFTLAMVTLLGSLPPHANGFNLLGMLGAATAYGVAANACYTMGWFLDMAARRVWGRNAPDVGPLLFRQGLIFSVGLTLLPLIPATLFWIARIVMAVTG